jgi:hypothetical protein
VGRVTTSTIAPLRSLSAILVAAFIALSLVVTTVDALAATPIAGERVRHETPWGGEFFGGRGLIGATWEAITWE